MKILVVGGGGREHAIIKKLKQSPKVKEIICAPGNGGISLDAVCFPVAATDIAGMIALAKEQAVDFVAVIPDDPLALGMVDEMEFAGFPCFGPNKAAAEIESSKVFAKELMHGYGIPTAKHRTFSDPEAAILYLQSQNEWPTVIKADGLALGKGVIIADDLLQAEAAVRHIMEEKAFGASGNQIVIEEFLTGPEVSVLAFCDGKTLIPMVSSMDHKRAYDGNLGPNTGGMGTIAPNPHYTADIAARCLEEIYLPTVRAMESESRPFKGCLYFGLMLTEKGPMVIEYNCRFGDPETQVVLPLLDGDLLDIMIATREGCLVGLQVCWKPMACACVILASGGYPGNYQKGILIHGLNPPPENVTVLHAGTKLVDGNLVTAGGRVLGVCAVGNTLDEALFGAYHAVKQIHFEGIQYRQDIGRYAK